MDFDFDKWLNDIGTANTPGAATFFSPAPAPAPISAIQNVSAVSTLPVLNEALLVPPVAMGGFIDNDIANASVPFSIAAGAGPSTGEFGFATGAGGPNAPTGGVGFATPDSRLTALRAFFNDAKALYAEVEGWQDGVPLEDRDARVLAGNRTHQLAMQVCWHPGPSRLFAHAYLVP